MSHLRRLVMVVGITTHDAATRDDLDAEMHEITDILHGHGYSSVQISDHKVYDPATEMIVFPTLKVEQR